MNNLGKIRRSQIITQAGPGAIIDFRTGKGPVSVVCAGLEHWPSHATILHEARLEKRLKVSELRAPPASGDGEGQRDHPLPGVPFPRWQQCPNCNLLKPYSEWGREPGEAAQHCLACSADGPAKVYVIPAPFVTACKKGHLDEFPWDYWVDHRDSCPRLKAYRLRSEGGAGLAGLILTCEGCGGSDSLEGCFNPDALKRFGECRGKRVWLPSADDDKCTAERQTLQRGASNMYFPVIVSALDIPPWSDGLQQKLKRDWDRITSFSEEQLRAFLSALQLHRQFSMTEEQLYREVLERRRSLESASAQDLRIDEYKQLTADVELPQDELSEFEIRLEQVPSEARPWLSKLVRVVRLREVRVLRAFTRIAYPDPELPDFLPEWAPLSATPQSWLPAVEVRGEGIFLELNQERVEKWSVGFERRAKPIHEAWAADWERRHPDVPVPRIVTPKLLLLHSLAHALIRQLSLECGYASASLRERLYVDGECCGFLIYTAAPDSDGTLGGLARQGKAERFLATLSAALRTQRWCASDPLCLSGAHAFSENATGAACHSCLLVSETSCEEFNRVLDRQTLVGGTDERETSSYFTDSPLLE